MGIENLLKPRYKVIADWPKNDWLPVGMIFIEEKESNIQFWNSYPHLFKKLEWWEDRRLDEMPAYVKVTEPNSLWGLPKDCVRPSQWSLDEYNKLVCDLFPVFVNNIQLRRLMPATREDYIKYNSSKRFNKQ